MKKTITIAIIFASIVFFLEENYKDKDESQIIWSGHNSHMYASEKINTNEIEKNNLNLVEKSSKFRWK